MMKLAFVLLALVGQSHAQSLPDHRAAIAKADVVQLLIDEGGQVVKKTGDERKAEALHKFHLDYAIGLFKKYGAEDWSAGGFSRLAAFVGFKGESVLLSDIRDKPLRIAGSKLDYENRRRLAARFYSDKSLDRPSWMLEVIQLERRKIHKRQNDVRNVRSRRASAAKSLAIRAATRHRNKHNAAVSHSNMARGMRHYAGH